MRRLLALLLVCACARRISGGPTPSVTGARNERDLSTAPASVCNAQGDPADGWLMDVLGDDFAPMPADLLSGTPALLMPVVRLDGPESFVVPDAQVQKADKTRLTVAMLTPDSSTPGHQLQPGLYSITVSNLNGASASVGNAVQVIPPPSETSVVVVPANGTAPSANVCDNEPTQTLVISGTGFRSGAPPTVSFVDASGAAVVTLNASVVTSTEVDVQIPSGTFTSTNPTAGGTQYSVQVTDPAGCGTVSGSTPRVLNVTDVNVRSTCGHLGQMAATPRYGWGQRNQAITVRLSSAIPQIPSAAPALTITAPLKG